jgi:hypothetical protein
MPDNVADPLAVKEYLPPVVEGTQEFRTVPKRRRLSSGRLGLCCSRHG